MRWKAHPKTRFRTPSRARCHTQLRLLIRTMVSGTHLRPARGSHPRPPFQMTPTTDLQRLPCPSPPRRSSPKTLPLRCRPLQIRPRGPVGAKESIPSLSSTLRFHFRNPHHKRLFTIGTIARTNRLSAAQKPLRARRAHGAQRSQNHAPRCPAASRPPSRLSVLPV